MRNLFVELLSATFMTNLFAKRLCGTFLWNLGTFIFFYPGNSFRVEPLWNLGEPELLRVVNFYVESWET